VSRVANDTGYFETLSRGRAGFEAFDHEERSLGLHPTAPAAANAVCAAAENERAAS